MKVNGQGTAPFDRRQSQWSPLVLVVVAVAFSRATEPDLTPEEVEMACNHLVRMSVVVAIAIGAAGAAAAQGPQRGERGSGMWNNEGPGPHMGMGMWGNGRWGRSSDWMLDRVEGRLAFLKAELKITDAQTAA